MLLEYMGWSAFFEDNFDRLGDATLKPARVIGVRRNTFVVYDGKEEYKATVSGRFLYESATKSGLPATGDWVTLKGPVITSVLPRKSALSRGASGNRGKLVTHSTDEQVIAANIDTVFIVCGLDRDYNIRRIERYLTLVHNSRCLPVVILNKADLHDRVERFADEVASVAFGAPVHVVSAKDSVGLEVLESYRTPGKTVVLVGSSGVGKSTLVNWMAGETIRVTQQVSDSVGKGVHTTSSRDLIRLPGGGMIIDNPGIREIAFWYDDGGIDAVFPRIDALARECRFSDCSHQHEPGCRVLEAASSGELAPGRLENYLKMKRELHYVFQRQQKSADRIEKERWKKIALRAKRNRRHQVSE